MNNDGVKENTSTFRKENVEKIKNEVFPGLNDKSPEDTSTVSEKANFGQSKRKTSPAPNETDPETASTLFLKENAEQPSKQQNDISVVEVTKNNSNANKNLSSSPTKTLDPVLDTWQREMETDEIFEEELTKNSQDTNDKTKDNFCENHLPKKQNHISTFLTTKLTDFIASDQFLKTNFLEISKKSL